MKKLICISHSTTTKYLTAGISNAHLYLYDPNQQFKYFFGNASVNCDFYVVILVVVSLALMWPLFDLLISQPIK